ncbi:MAG: hypothetical protein RRA35_07400, partial [Desulfomonilia bacterium]|nr:hypothetical protein [Desulfomonilia bacterium]
MTSTHDLIAQIPDYMMGIISTHLIGHACDVRALSEAMSDADRLEKIVSALPQEQKTILMDIYELGSQVSWEVLSRLSPAGLDTLRAHLEELGSAGLLFQNGLTDADQIILLPSLNYLLEELRRSNFRAPTELTWKQKLTVSIWGHLSLLNTIRAFRIRCKGSLEPFKKGWELLGEKLESLGDIRTIYEELVDLGCIREVNGEVAVQGRAALALAMEGDARYSIWRFLQSCKTSPGLEFRVFNLVGDEAVSREFFLRILNLHHASTGEDAEGSQRTMPLHGDDQVDLWIGLGLLQEDTTGRYLRFADG